MENTQNAIAELYLKMQEWGMLDHLTVNEKNAISHDLKQIARTAIHDVRSEMIDLMSNVYIKLAK
jgi:hypothetical protein